MHENKHTRNQTGNVTSDCYGMLCKLHIWIIYTYTVYTLT